MKKWNIGEDFKVIFDRGNRKWWKIFNPKLKREKEQLAIYDDHPMPVTRRDFIKAGIIDGLMLTAAPSVLNLLNSTNAQASNVSNVVILYMNGNGGAGWMNRFTAAKDKDGGNVSQAGRNGMGIFVDPDQSGEQLADNYGVPGMLRSNNVNAAWLQRDRSAAYPVLGDDPANPERYVWRGISDTDRDAVLDKVSLSLLYCRYPDDGSGEATYGSSTPHFAKILDSLSNDYLIKSGLVVGSPNNLVTGLITRHVGLIGTAPPYMAVASTGAVERAIGNPTGLSNNQAVALVEAQKELSEKAAALKPRSLASKLPSKFETNRANIVMASSLDFNRRSVFGARTNLLLDRLGDIGNRLGESMVSAMNGWSHPCITFNGGSDGHAGGVDMTGYSLNALNLGTRYANVMAAFFSACEEKGKIGVVLFQNNGGMDGYVDANGAGHPFGAGSDEGRTACHFAALFHPSGRKLPAQGIYGSRDTSTGFASTEGIGGSPGNVGIWLASAALPFILPNWAEAMTSTFEADALATYPNLFENAPWPTGSSG